MRLDDLVDAIGKINPRYVKEAEEGGKKKRISAPVWLSLAACLALVLTGSYLGLRFGGEAGGGAPEGSPAASGVPENQAAEADAVSDEAIDGAAAPEEAPELIYNEIRELEYMIVDMEAPARIEQVDAEGLEAYFAVPILPEVLPEDLSLQAEEFAIGYNEEGAAIDDNNELLYADASKERSLTVGVRTTESGEITRFADSDLETSEVCGVEVTAAHYRNGEKEDCYIAQFERGGVMFTVQSENLSEDEFTAAVCSLLEQAESGN